MKSLFFVLLFCLAGTSARAEIKALQASDIRDLLIETVAGGQCFSAADSHRYRLKVITAGATYVRQFCSDDRDAARWRGLYADLKALVAGVASSECLKSETCRGRECRRTYGTTLVTRHIVTVFTNGNAEIQDSSVTLNQICQ